MEMYNRNEICKSLYTVFKNIGEKTFVDDRPSSTTTQMNSFVVIKVGEVDPMHAYGDTYVTLKVFQRDNDGTSKVTPLSDMEQKVYSLLPIDNDLYKALKPKTLEAKSDGSGFHYLTIYFDLILK
jgi:hypothetical protein